VCSPKVFQTQKNTVILNTTELLTGQSVDEKLFRLLVSSVTDYAIFLIDVNGYILSWNEGAERIHGYRGDDIVGRQISVFYRPHDHERKLLSNSLKQALINGMHETEGWRVRKNGSVFWANDVLTTLYNDQGNLIGFANVSRDVTERKLAEEKKAQVNAELEKRVQENTQKIIANEIRFRKLIENSYEGIALFDDDLNTVYRSPSCERINGWTFEEEMQYKALDMVHPDDALLMESQFKKLLQNPLEPIILNCRTRHKQGHYIWVECIFHNMLHDVNVKAIVCNFRDVTEQHNAQLERERITTDLVQRNKDLEQYAYIISHNLRAPVANIAGLSGLLKEMPASDDEQATTLDMLTHAVKNLDNVILNLNHILQASSEANDQIEEVSLSELVKTIQLSINSLIQKSKAVIDSDFGKIDRLFTLKSYLHSIVQNLITNSIKYKRPYIKPVISIHSEITGNNIVIYFKDNGRGIDLAKHSNQIFGLYKRFDHTVEGRGMGLFMVKMQVERLGGSIGVESEINKGTVFTIKFPLCLMTV
jgi:PAS domain S-box-containing protein